MNIIKLVITNKKIKEINIFKDLYSNPKDNNKSFNNIKSIQSPKLLIIPLSKKEKKEKKNHNNKNNEKNF